MFRRLPIFILVFAALLAAEPLLHNHPLRPIGDRATSGATCAVCAAGGGRLPIIAAAVAAPRAIIFTIVVAPVTMVAIPVTLSLTSRAPPAL